MPMPLPTTCAAACGHMYTSPTSRPSGCSNGYAITSVRPRRPVARRFRRRMATADSSVMSTCECAGARSHASTRCATRSRLVCRRGLPRRADAATGLRIIDAVVVHPAEHYQECLFHLLDLLQRERCLIELSGADLGPDDVIDRF